MPLWFGKAKQVLEALSQGTSPDDLAKTVPWKSLSSRDREDLLGQIRKLEDGQLATKLVLFLYRISRDDWYTIRVLGQAVQLASFSLEDKFAAVNTIKKRLDRIETETGNPEKDTRMYRQLRESKAYYYLLLGQVNLEAGKKEEALGSFRESQSIYQELELSPYTNFLESKISSLTEEAVEAPEIPAQEPQKEELVKSIQALQAEKERLSREVEQFKVHFNQGQQYYNELVKRLKIQAGVYKELQNRISQLQCQIEENESEKSALEQVIAALREQATALNEETQQATLSKENLLTEQEALAAQIASLKTELAESGQKAKPAESRRKKSRSGDGNHPEAKPVESQIQVEPAVSPTIPPEQNVKKKRTKKPKPAELQAEDGYQSSVMEQAEPA